MPHSPRKRFGQNFLHDPAIIERLVSVIRPQPGQHIIEIGPGQAAITLPLLASGAEITVVEIDRDLAASLETRFQGENSLQMINADALSVDFGQLANNQPFRLVGNLPYNISTPLLFHVLQWSGQLTDAHFMLQKEVVQRMAASPGSKQYGRLSVMTQLHCRVEALFIVRPGAFNPPPKVDSQIVRLVPYESPPVAIRDHKRFEALVRDAFGQRRKQLANSLKNHLSADQIQSAGIAPTQRPENLTLAEFAALERASH